VRLSAPFVPKKGPLLGGILRSLNGQVLDTCYLWSRKNGRGGNLVTKVVRGGGVLPWFGHGIQISAAFFQLLG